MIGCGLQNEALRDGASQARELESSRTGTGGATARSLASTRAPDGGPQACRPQRFTDRRRARQTEREDPGERRPRGYEAGRKLKGHKRQVMVDTDGRGLILELSQPTCSTTTAPAPAEVVAPPRSRTSPGPSPTPAMRETHTPPPRSSLSIRSHATRPDRLLRPSAAMGGRALLRMDQPEPPAMEVPGGDHRLR